MYVVRQRDPLDEQFDELFKDASDELREKIDMELLTDGDAGSCADGDTDSDILVVEYVSDDDTLSVVDDERDDDCDHVLKVRLVFVFCLCVA